MSRLSFRKFVLAFAVILFLVFVGIGFTRLSELKSGPEVSQPVGSAKPNEPRSEDEIIAVDDSREEKNVDKNHITDGAPMPSSTVKGAPKLPVIHMQYSGQVYQGERGSYCWPTMMESGGGATTFCVTAIPDPSDIIPVRRGDVLTILVESHARPLELSALVADSYQKPPIEIVTLKPELKTSFTADLPPGLYIIVVGGQWSQGDVSYAFKIEVR